MFQYSLNALKHKLSETFAWPMDLKDNKSFCVLPWVHMYIEPNGRCSPCCVSDVKAEPYGHLKDNSLEMIWNSKRIKQFRQDLLAGNARSDFCKGCYQKEAVGENSDRQHFNKIFFHKIAPSLQKTENDGYFQDLQWSYWDFRLSNKCNFRCRTCGPIFSSAWQSELKVHQPELLSLEGRPIWQEGFEFFKKHGQKIERIYFAGGEPLIIDEHYQMLEWLIENKKTDVVLTYNTNLSELEYKDWRIFELWKKFRQVFVFASLDHYEKQAEFVRKGTRWENIVDNIEKIKLQHNIHVSPTITISLLNILEFPKIHAYFTDMGLVKNVNGFSANILKSPEFYSISCLPSYLKEKVRRELREYSQKMQRNHGRKLNCLALILQELDLNTPHLFPQFIDYMTKLDQVRGENFKLLYPDYVLPT